jgi:hypothetical protein
VKTWAACCFYCLKPPGMTASTISTLHLHTRSAADSMQRHDHIDHRIESLDVIENEAVRHSCMRRRVEVRVSVDPPPPTTLNTLRHFLTQA